MLYIAAVALGVVGCTKETVEHHYLPAEEEVIVNYSFDTGGLKVSTGSLSGKVDDPDNFPHTYDSTIVVSINDGTNTLITHTLTAVGSTSIEIEDAVSSLPSVPLIAGQNYNFLVAAYDSNPVLHTSSGLDIPNTGATINGSTVLQNAAAVINGHGFRYPFEAQAGGTLHFPLTPTTTLFTFDWNITGPRAADFSLNSFYADDFITQNSGLNPGRFGIGSKTNTNEAYFYAETAQVQSFVLTAIIDEVGGSPQTFTENVTVGNAGTHAHYALGFTANHNADGSFSTDINEFSDPDTNTFGN